MDMDEFSSAKRYAKRKVTLTVIVGSLKLCGRLNP